MTELFELQPDWQYNLIVTKGDLPAAFKLPARLRLRYARSEIYTLKEQIEIAAIASIDSDVIWVPHYNIPFLAFSPIICTIHDVTHLAVAEINQSIIRRAYATAMMQMIRLRANHVLFVSKFSEHEFNRLVGRTRHSISITYNSVSHKWLDYPGNDSPESKYIFSSKYIIFVGNVKPHKNLVRLLEAFKLVIKRHDIKLVIVGKREGFIVSDDRVAIEAEELGDRIVFTGFVAETVLIDLVARAQALIFPSLYEGFGIPPLEAMAVSCPTVVSDIPSIREACGEASLYVDPLNVDSIAAGILAVLEGASLQDELRQAGRTRVTRFSGHEGAKTLADAIRAVARPVANRSVRQTKDISDG